MADWVTLTVELDGCEPIDCRVELKNYYPWPNANMHAALSECAADLAPRAEQLIESRGYGRKE